MEILYFTIAGIALYLAADWALNMIERWLGYPLPYRSVVFGLILMVLALVTFAVLREYAPG